MSAKFKYRRFKASKIIAVVGVVFILVSASLVFFWETEGREHFLYRQVIVMSANVEAGTTVTNDMLEIKTRTELFMIEKAKNLLNRDIDTAVLDYNST